MQSTILKSRMDSLAYIVGRIGKLLLCNQPYIVGRIGKLLLCNQPYILGRIGKLLLCNQPTSAVINFSKTLEQFIDINFNYFSMNILPTE